MNEIPLGEWLEADGPNHGASYPGRPIPPMRLPDNTALTDTDTARLRRLLDKNWSDET